MGKWLVLYSSVTGNTRRVAEAMAEAAGADCRALGEVPEDLASYEVVALGYWLWRGGPDPKMAKFLPGVRGKEIIFFETHGTLPYTEHAITAFARAALLLGSGCKILGTFGCQGKINPVMIERRKKAGKEDPHVQAGSSERWESAASHPDEQDLAAAADFMKKMQRKLDLKQKFALRMKKQLQKD